MSLACRKAYVLWCGVTKARLESRGRVNHVQQLPGLQPINLTFQPLDRSE